MHEGDDTLFGGRATSERHRREARGVKTPLTNEEIVKKYRALVVDMVWEGEREAVEKVVLSLDSCTDAHGLFTLLDIEAKSFSHHQFKYISNFMKITKWTLWTSATQNIGLGHH
ncbi:hypothetical protein JB92DRAFT_3008240 [Gautieria morchelliformis]|nr:hypothetical protein JB92DRAFT_3008240 [Gautieria morchelliformis]